MRFNLFKTLLLASAPLALNAWASELVVIASAGVNLTADEVRDVFVGDKQLAGQLKLVPLDNTAAQEEFLSKVVKVNAGKYASIWAKKGFREGINPPPLRGSDAEVILAVKNSLGAIGYVSKAPADVKVILKY